ncbi:hypothetical protein EXW62_27330 (plasmid) [Bacillus mycoides]|uniref:BglII/BstYI family type II restriction endonuclease n=1 Tax=Bacillus mycoides TaxID=1405 RepID=UPI001C03252C|nr:BglII/BstYI family type II restriction endonuclease [Bacillus mycoides]QWH20716.1 hypothetical protein EXW62_27330 [Bacillus mycoides]
MNELKGESIQKWSNKQTGTLYIKNQVFHRHSDLFLEKHNQLKQDVESCIQRRLSNLEFKALKKNESYQKRLGAKSLNASIRSNLRNMTDMKFEVECKDGVLYDSPKIGRFDFALFDSEYNIMNLRNLCFGRRALHDGANKWSKELSDRPEWNAIVNKINLPTTTSLGEDIPVIKRKPTVVGEVQFGNWALGYKDMFRVLKLDETLEVDLLIYIAATGNLEKYLSANIVTFDQIKKTLDEFGSIVKVPIWLIGIDMKD